MRATTVTIVLLFLAAAAMVPGCEKSEKQTGGPTETGSPVKVDQPTPETVKPTAEPTEPPASATPAEAETPPEPEVPTEPADEPTSAETGDSGPSTEAEQDAVQPAKKPRATEPADDPDLGAASPETAATKPPADKQFYLGTRDPDVPEGELPAEPPTVVEPTDASGAGEIPQVEPVERVDTTTPVEIDGVTLFRRAEYWPNGQLQKKWHVKLIDEDLEVMHGPAETRYPDGRIWEEALYTDGKRIGKHTTYYRGGAVMKVSQWDNNRLHGPSIMYHENGAVMVEQNYQEGARFGVELWYYENGQQWIEVHLLDDKRNGPYIVWDEAGEVVDMAEYVNDERQP